MPRRFSLFIAFAGIVAIAAFFQSFRLLSAQRASLEKSRQNALGLEPRLTQQRLETEATLNELTLASGQLEKLTVGDARAQSPEEHQRKEEIATWLARTQKIRRLFNDRPDQFIPEITLLSDVDWLQSSRTFEGKNENEIQAALAGVRKLAQQKLASSLSHALRRFIQASPDSVPASTAALVPYLENQNNAEFLARYEIAQANTLSRLGKPVQRWSLQNRSVINAFYDENYLIEPDGWESGSALREIWSGGISTRVQQAYEAYSKANPRSPPSAASTILPYINPPLDPAIVEKLLKAESNTTR